MLPRKLLLLMAALLALLSLTTMANGVPPDTTPPTIETPIIVPANPGPIDPATVSVVVYDARGVQNVSIFYTTDNWTSVTVALVASYDSTSSIATATIPAQQGGGHVSYYVEAFDTSGNRGVNDNGGAYFTYEVPAGPITSITSLWGLLIVAIIAALAGMVLLAYLSRRKKTSSVNQARLRRQSVP